MHKWRIVNEWPEIVLSRVDSGLQLVTLKASLIIPANAVLLNLLIPTISSRTTVTFGSILSSFGAILILFSMFSSVAAISAFLKGDHGSGNLFNSLFFFGAISSMRLEDFISKARNSQPDEISEDVLRQIHLLSCALVSKFRLVNLSLGFLVSGTFTALLGLFVT